ncbi:MAG: YheC/YheD family protein [Bacillota bacterium]|nr:YheC/YheD family protein [Bacillota bacterium]
MNILWLSTLNSNEIILSIDIFEELKRPERITLHFGALKLKLNVVFKKDFKVKNTIGLPNNLSKVYTIPNNVQYECILTKRHIYLGPVIAYVALGRHKNLLNKVYVSYLPKFLEYNSIKGLIFVCAEQSVNVDSGILEGYYYQPNNKKPKQAWKYGKFPLPNAIFNRSLMSQEKICSIQKVIGNKVFNSYLYNLDKLNTWNLLSRDDFLKKHLPYTEKFNGNEQVERLLSKYESIYLKPCDKSQGRGLMMVSKEGSGVSLVDNKGQKYYFANYQELAIFLDKKIKRPYIIQQAVHFKSDNRHIDFRVVLQRDGNKKWNCSGLVARIAFEGSIITNKRGRETSMLGREALNKIFSLNAETAVAIEEEMTQMVIKAVEKYEEQGHHLGDLAADIVLDSNLQIWLLELQLNYGVDARAGVLPDHFLKKIKTTPFQYAKTLAGWKEN